ncbi:MAG TPA: hypothetical protein VF469_28330 [Kofleriaceae bacterium]
MTHKLYDPNPKLLVLSADSFNHTVAPHSQVNHVPWTRIYGDGRTVFVDPAKGDSEIFQGHLDAKQISHLFERLQAKGFFGFEDVYWTPGMVGVGARAITAVRRGQPEKRVTCYTNAPSAPPAFHDCFEALLYPHIHPSDVKSYVREHMSRTELAQGWYWGFEYQKKLDTPADWVWIEAGKSSKWCKPPVHSVSLDSSYMIPPVGTCRHIRVFYNDDPTAEGGTIQFDRNSMSPNEFGDIGMSTRMWCEPQPATYTLLETKDDKRLFSATVSGYSGANLQLVVIGDPARPTGGRLLELDDHGAIQNIHWLQAAPQS